MIGNREVMVVTIIIIVFFQFFLSNFRLSKCCKVEMTEINKQTNILLNQPVHNNNE